MKQGTKSILIGCHSPVHAYYVLKAWIKIYGSWPSWWQLICIALHDIGHLGKQYLDNYEEKKQHWILGAKIARVLFGEKGYEFVAGHCDYSGTPESALYKADKGSFAFVPVWWGIWSAIVEPELHAAEIKRGMTRRQAVVAFIEDNKRRLEAGIYQSNHRYYLDRRGE